MKAIWDAIKRFFRWPYNVYTLFLILGLIELFAGYHWFGGITIILDFWVFLISLNAPKHE